MAATEPLECGRNQRLVSCTEKHRRLGTHDACRGGVRTLECADIEMWTAPSRATTGMALASAPPFPLHPCRKIDVIDVAARVDAPTFGDLCSGKRQNVARSTTRPLPQQQPSAPAVAASGPVGHAASSGNRRLVSELRSHLLA